VVDQDVLEPDSLFVQDKAGKTGFDLAEYDARES
jgi:hypothetical protein